MGDWDYFCALCGAGFEPKLLRLDVSHMKSDPLKWLAVFRILSRNNSSSAERNCFVSGPAQSCAYGHTEFEPGDHPNAPAHENDDYSGSVREDGVFRLDGVVYRDIVYGTPHLRAAIPIHGRCFTILQKKFLVAGHCPNGVLI